MSRQAIYLSHPEVLINPKVPTPRWGLSDVGKERVARLAVSDALAGIKAVFASDETKALEAAAPLAQSLGVSLQIDPAMGENDRSATGFLPEAEFQATANAFFGSPDTSVRGWETARAAQSRVVDAVARAAQASRGDLLFVGHGAVGTLLYCHLRGLPINRRHDQPGRGGGNAYRFALPDGPAQAPWAPMEDLMVM